MPGTPLSGAERAEWIVVFKDLRADKQTLWADNLARAPAADHAKAYTVQDFRDMVTDEEVKEACSDVAGMRKGDIVHFCRYWKAVHGQPDTDNQPVVASKVQLAVEASVARADSDAQRQAVVAASVTQGFADQDEVEGKSMFCYVLFRVKPDSGKLGLVAKFGSEPEESDYIFTEKGMEVATVEWPKHLTSSGKWRAYLRRCKDNARKYNRFGIVNRIGIIIDFCDEMMGDDWTLHQCFWTAYFEKHNGKLLIAEDSALYTKVFHKWDRAGRPKTLPAGGVEQILHPDHFSGGPPPKTAMITGGAQWNSSNLSRQLEITLKDELNQAAEESSTPRIQAIVLAMENLCSALKAMGRTATEFCLPAPDAVEDHSGTSTAAPAAASNSSKKKKKKKGLVPGAPDEETTANTPAAVNPDVAWTRAELAAGRKPVADARWCEVTASRIASRPAGADEKALEEAKKVPNKSKTAEQWKLVERARKGKALAARNYISAEKWSSMTPGEQRAVFKQRRERRAAAPAGAAAPAAAAERKPKRQRGGAPPQQPAAQPAAPSGNQFAELEVQEAEAPSVEEE